MTAHTTTPSTGKLCVPPLTCDRHPPIRPTTPSRVCRPRPWRTGVTWADLRRRRLRAQVCCAQRRRVDDPEAEAQRLHAQGCATCRPALARNEDTGRRGAPFGATFPVDYTNLPLKRDRPPRPGMTPPRSPRSPRRKWATWYRADRRSKTAPSWIAVAVAAIVVGVPPSSTDAAGQRPARESFAAAVLGHWAPDDDAITPTMPRNRFVMPRIMARIGPHDAGRSCCRA